MTAAVLFVGQAPNTIDFSEPGLPDVTPDEIYAGAEAARRRLIDLGYDVAVCETDAGERAEEIVRACLQDRTYACVVIGAGIRLPPDNLRLFEIVVNAVHRHAPDAAIAFNVAPDDSADAALRWLR